MKAKGQDLQTDNIHLFGRYGRQKSHECHQHDLKSEEMSIECQDTEMTGRQFLQSQLQTVNSGLSGAKETYCFDYQGDEQNVDMENCSTQATSVMSGIADRKAVTNTPSQDDSCFSAK